MECQALFLVAHTAENALDIEPFIHVNQNNCFSVQQTQKSFSIMASATPLRSAVSAKISARAPAAIRAISFKPPSPQFVSLLRRSNPPQTGRLSPVSVSQPGIEPRATSQSRGTLHRLYQ